MSTWIPKEQRDTRWYIWHKLFMCRVSNIQTMSLSYLQHFGMPTSGDTREDQATAHELVTRMLSVNQMVEYFKAGINVRVVNYKDTKEIYEIITNHLNAWKYKVENEFNVRDAPIDDLILLDSFAVAVYKHARHQFDRQYVDSVLARRISSTLRVTRDRILKPPEPKVIRINADDGSQTQETEKKFPEHESMADVFLGSQRISNGAPKWR